MKIQGFFIEGFGVFSQVHLKNIPGGLSVFLGDNEAGKSTLLSFLRAMFFGLASGRSRENRYPPLAGGRHGGRLDIVSDRGTELTLERWFGARATVQLSGLDSTHLSSQDLAGLLGGITRDVYRNVYAFSLDELQNFQNLEKEHIKAAINSAALGAGRADLGRIESVLKKGMEDLFRPRGSKPRINRLLAEFESLRKKIRLASGQTDRYRNLLLELEQVEKDISKVEERAGVLEQAVRCLDILSEIREEWREVSSLESRMARLTLEQENYRSVTERGPDILDLRERKGAYLQLLSELPDAGAELKSEQAEVDRCLASLGSGWTEERVRSFDGSLFTRQSLEAFSDEIENAKARLRTAEHQAGVCHESLKKAEQRVRLAGRRLEKAGTEQSMQNIRVLKRLRSRRDYVYELWAGLQERRGSLAEARQALSDAVRDIDPRWTPADLEALDMSAGVQEKILRLGGELGSARGEIEQVEREIQRVEGEITALEERLRSRKSSMRELRPDDCPDMDGVFSLQRKLHELSQVMRQSETLGRELDSLTSRILEKEQQLRDADARPGGGRPLPILRHAPWFFILAGCAASGAFLFFHLYQWVVAGILCVAAGGYSLWGMRNQTALSERAERERKLRVKGLEQDLSALKDEHLELSRNQSVLLETQRRLADELGLNACTPDELSGCEARLNGNLSRLYRLENERAVLAELEQGLDAMRLQLERLKSCKSRAQEHLKNRQREWNDLLLGLRLKEDIEPHDFSRLFSAVERARGLSSRVHELEKEVSHIENEAGGYVLLARSLGMLPDSAFVDVESFFGGLDTLFSRWEQEEKALERGKAIREDLEEAQDELRRCREEARDAQVRLELAEGELNEVRNRFEKWLNGLGLPKGISVRGAWKALDILEKCLDAIAARDRTLYRIKEIRNARDDFEKRARRLLRALGLEMEVLPGLDRACMLLDKASENARSLDEVRWKLEHVRGVAEGRWNSLQQILMDIEADLQNDPAWNDVFSRISGKDLTAFLSGAGDADFARLEKTRVHLDGRVAARREDLKSLVEKRAALVHEQKGLVSSEELEELRCREEELLQDIRSLSREWAVLASAGYLLDQARKRFEEKYQPMVLRDASRFFKTITRGRYEKILVPLDGSGIKAVDAEGGMKSPEMLSRGTAEQLYLSLRFGYILNYSFGGEMLPVVMDDILVNFDAARALSAVRAVSELSRERQVFYFTCHPHMAAMFREVDADAGFYRMEGGSILPWMS